MFGLDAAMPAGWAAGSRGRAVGRRARRRAEVACSGAPVGVAIIVLVI
jgi:hypothetical protein